MYDDNDDGVQLNVSKWCRIETFIEKWQRTCDCFFLLSLKLAKFLGGKLAFKLFFETTVTLHIYRVT